MATFRPLLGSIGIRLNKLLDNIAVLAESLVVGDKLFELHAIFELFRCAGSLMTCGMRPYVHGFVVTATCMSRAQRVPGARS